MGRHDQYEETADIARIREVDEALSKVLLVAVIGIALNAMFGIPEHGWVYATLSSLPAAIVVCRRAFLDDLIGIRRGVELLIASAFVVCVGASSLADGINGHGPFFACLVAMFGMMMFPSRRWLGGLGVGIVATVFVIDLIVGRDVDSEFLSAAFVLAAAVPAGLGRMVSLERLHRNRSIIDPLTGCLNRRAMSSRATEIEAQADRVPIDLAVISFDVDHFKRTNDEHGHAAGDRVLAHIAYTARKVLRTSEVVYRIGGEEFIVLLPGTTEVEASTLAERLRVAIAAESVGGVSVTASFGVAGARWPFTVDALVAEADERVYSAKEGGRNIVVATCTPSAA